MKRYLYLSHSICEHAQGKVLLDFTKANVVLSLQDDFSPTSKLQRLLAESRQMVTDLELSTLLPISSENLSTGAKNVRGSYPFDHTPGVQILQ